MTLPASEETVPATDAEIAKLEQLATVSDMCGHDKSVLSLISRIKLEREQAVRECAEKSISMEVSDAMVERGHAASPVEYAAEFDISHTRKIIEAALRGPQ